MSNRAGRSAGSLLTLLLLTPGLGLAQSADQRATLDAWRDSLAGLTDTTHLLALEEAGIEVARADRDNPIHHLRLGFLAIRLGELGGKSHFDDAAGEFEWAAELAPSWPYAWLGLGLAERAMARPAGNLLYGVMAWLGRDQRTVAAGGFARAVEADPGFFPALEELHETSSDQRLNRRLEITLGAFRRAAATGATDEVRYYLYRGRLERQVGDVDSAVSAFERYLDRGGERGLGLLELARTSFLTDSGEGGDLYYQGAALDDPAAVAEYRTDLDPIADSAELAAFDAAAGVARVELLRRFWTTRDDADLRARGERLREHYRRLGFAREHYPAPPFLRRLGYGDYYTNESDFDDRGVIHVRHGEPTVRRVVVNPTADAYGAEIWRYERPEGPMVFFFLAASAEENGDPNDYRLKADPFSLPLRDDDLHAVSPELVSSNVAGARYAQEAFIRGKRDIAVGTSTDSHVLRFEETLETRAQVAVGGGRPEGSFLHVAYSVPREDAFADSAGGVPLEVRLAVYDAAGDVVARVDSAARWEARDSAGVESLLGRVSASVPSGRLSYRIALINGPRGSLFRIDSVTVHGAGSGLSLSEPILGSRSLGLGWVDPAGVDTLFFNPLLAFETGSDLEVFYELHGASPGSEYTTKLEVRKEGGGLLRKIFGGGKRIELTFSETAPRPVVRVNRTIRLGDLEEGRYTLRIAVRGPDEGTVTRERRFRVRP